MGRTGLRVSGGTSESCGCQEHREVAWGEEGCGGSTQELKLLTCNRQCATLRALGKHVACQAKNVRHQGTWATESDRLVDPDRQLEPPAKPRSGQAILGPGHDLVALAVRLARPDELHCCSCRAIRSRFNAPAAMASAGKPRVADPSRNRSWTEQIALS
jgi:hypothetical protein